MKKIIVIGSGGAGKSTFSRRLGEILGLPVVHLDRLYWRPNWVEPTKQEWSETVRSELARDSWIMDGNYGATRGMRFQAGDAIVFLDIPRLVCLYRVVKRAILYHGKTRPDMADGCSEQIDLVFFLWVWGYKNRGRVKILEELKGLTDKKIVVLKSRQEIEEFLAKQKNNRETIF